MGGLQELRPLAAIHVVPGPWNCFHLSSCDLPGSMKGGVAVNVSYAIASHRDAIALLELSALVACCL